MAIYRNVHMCFWTDPKVEDDFTADDRYFFLYLMTNTHTNLCGCYELSISQIDREMGLKNKKKVENLIDRMQRVHKNIIYSHQTKEVLILRWHKYNWTSSEKFRKPLIREIEQIKNEDFKEYLLSIFNGEDTISIIEEYGIDTTDTVSVTDTDTVTDSDCNIHKDIIDYLNMVCGTKYKHTTRSTIKNINARVGEGYSLEDFKKVIDTKFDEWHNDSKMSKYLNPDTLFGTKFEKYLNQISVGAGSRVSVVDDW